MLRPDWLIFKLDLAILHGSVPGGEVGLLGQSSFWQLQREQVWAMAAKLSLWLLQEHMRPSVLKCLPDSFGI